MLCFYLSMHSPFVCWNPWLSGKDPVKETQEAWIPSLGQEDPLEREMATHSSGFSGKPMDRGARWAAVHGVAKVLDMTYQLNNNSSVLTFQLLDWVLNSMEKLSFWDLKRSLRITAVQNIQSKWVWNGTEGQRALGTMLLWGKSSEESEHLEKLLLMHFIALLKHLGKKLRYPQN